MLILPWKLDQAQRPVNRAESLRSMHILPAGGSLGQCCPPGPAPTWISPSTSALPRVLTHDHPRPTLLPGPPHTLPLGRILDSPLALTLGNVLHIRLVAKDVLQPLHEQQGLVIALNTVFPAMEHLIQGSGLHLPS